MKISYFKILTVLLTGIVLSACSLPFISSNKKTALSITATPKASVFLDGKHIGSTPFYEEKLKPQEYSIRLVPENGIGAPWEKRIKLSAGILTVVSRELGETNDKSSGYDLSLEPDAKDKASISVVTIPEGAVVSIDGEPVGFAPKTVDNLSAGDHVILISSPGYIEKSFKAQLVEGYKLIASVQLAKSDQVTEKATDKGEEREIDIEDEEETIDADLDENEEELIGSELEPPYITVNETPTGWLNVREKASTAEDIITKINPSESYKFIEANDIGWYKIELEDGREGWISSKYVKLFQDSSDAVDDKDDE